MAKSRLPRRHLIRCLPEHQQVLVAERYGQGATFSKLAKHFQCSVYAISEALKVQCTPVRRSQDAKFEPTAEEIEKRIREVQASWTEEERISRKVGGYIPYTIPVVSASSLRTGGGSRCRIA